ncbi:tyrosine-protein kinase family protein [Burkholderia cepacia]|uniref:Tetratricopeptide tpr 1 repeat-containing protein n=1 Tax=Burkholderia cepacia GG4 TaxID=1009846 RepID=A0A9W3P848_BURCE|nr:AAA family ATPase [Burkholderia cepacia]AFQ47020.1 tetratricopeptide tpr 1 repeat-containing protein [Burkholderia cepacia GG4]
MSETRFVAFYSFKGGVGRSMTLANVAYHLAKDAKRVLVIDFDLEAPGQIYSDLFRGISVTKGVLELLTSFVSASYTEDDTRKFLHDFDLAQWVAISPIASENDASTSLGTIALLPAGSFEDPLYDQRLADFKWDTFYKQKGRAFIEILKERIRAAGYDYVLLDSRTGLTDIFYVTAFDFADTVVMMSGMNRQNVAGIRKAYELLQSPEALSHYGHRQLLLVASPVPDVPLDDRRRRQNDIRIEWPEAPPFDVYIPYVAELALTERLLSREADDLGQPTPYGQQCADLTSRIVNRTASAPSSGIKPSNPFSIVRRDYISEDDLVRYYVDPGNVTVGALQEFPPVIVTGARGSGKTTLASIFSLDAWHARARADGTVSPRDMPSQIGLYFRIDADILRGFAPSDEESKLNERLFNQYLDLTITQKAIRVLDKVWPLEKWLDEQRFFTRMYSQFGVVPDSGALNKSSFLDFIESQLTLVTLILNNPDRNFNQLVFVQPNALLKILASEVGQSELMRGRYLAISIDEFENFLPFQQRVVNTRLKQTKREDGVTWRLFARSEVFLTSETLAHEQRIEETHDFRSYSLDDVTFDEFEVHVTRVANRHLELSPFFRALGINDIQQLLASMSDEEEAQLLKASGRKLRPLLDWVHRYYPGDEKIISEFVEGEPNFLRAATAVVVMNQGATTVGLKSPPSVIAEFQQDGAASRNWYSNYKRGALFWLCTLYRKNKQYAGTAALLGLSGRNMRYFLDFCNRVVAEWLTTYDSRGVAPLLPILPQIQDQAIRSQALDYQRNVQRTDKSARQLYQLIERLGRVFEAAHKSPKQSEPEINHFSIKETVALSDEKIAELDKYLRDAVFEDVLKQLPGTKQKNLRSARLDAWQLAPRFAPLFDLSTRKKKSLDLTDEDLYIIFSGSDDDWGRLFNRFRNRFNVGEVVANVVTENQESYTIQPKLF